MRRVFAALLVIAACRDAEPQPEATPDAAGVESRELPPSAAAAIELLDAGAQPRTPIRLHPTAGTETPLAVALSLQMKMRAGGTEAPAIATPKVTVHGRVIIDSVTDEEIRVRHLADTIELEAGADVPAELETDLQRAVEGLSAYRASLRVDPRGFVRGGVVDVPRSATGPAGQLLAQLADAYGQALIPVPEVPVGAGARWTATRDVDQSGMKLRQTTTYRLVARDADAIEVTAEVEQTLRAADLDAASMPGVRAKLLKFSGKGTSTTTFDLAAAAPLRSEQRTDVRMILDVDAAGQSSRQEIDLALELTMVRPPSP